MNETRKFLSAHFENKPEDTFIAIWQTPLKTTRRFKKWEDAADFVEKIKDSNAEIYYCCGLQDKDHGGARRGTKNDIVGITGFYIDIDIQDPVHKSKNLPPTVDAAVALVVNRGFDPTMIVHTGHGIHAHWIFKEPEMFATAEQREKIETLCRRLQQTIKENAKKHSWSLDSTYDVSRVLRIPGTFNNKNTRRPVKLIFEDGPIYSSAEDFDEFLIPEDQLDHIAPAPTAKEQKIILSNITLSESAEPPADQLDWLCDLDVKFKATWFNKRDPKSFPKGKASPSEYAMSLASIAVQAGWSDQQVANLIIAWYRRHGHDINKAMRGDYIARTLAVAKKDVDQRFVKDYRENIEPTENTVYHKDLDPQGEETKRFLSIEFGFKVVRLVKYAREKHPYYVMFTDKKTGNNNGTVHFETENHLIKKDRFEAAVFAQIDHCVDIQPKNWGGIKKKFTSIMETVEVEESYIAGRMKAWILEYLENKRQLTCDQTAGSKEPFVEKDHWHIYKDPFSRWCYNNKGHLEGVKKTELDLVLVGAEEKQYNPKHPNSKDPKKRTTRRAYMIPHDIINPKADKADPKIDLDQYQTSDSDSDINYPTVH